VNLGLLDSFKRGSKVLMVCSVDEYVAGESYVLDAELADRFIARGYATGDLSRPYTAEELASLKTSTQVVSL
jgi:hypothetical protein